MNDRDRHERRENVLLALGCAVIGVWLVLILIQGAFPDHEVPKEVHGIVFVVASALFGTAAWQGRKADKA